MDNSTLFGLVAIVFGIVICTLLMAISNNLCSIADTLRLRYADQWDRKEKAEEIAKLKTVLRCIASTKGNAAEIARQALEE